MGAYIECFSLTPVIWSYMERRLPIDAKVDVNMLTIAGVNIDNAGVYECQGTDEDYKIFTSRSTLIVNGKITFIDSCIFRYFDW